MSFFVSLSRRCFSIGTTTRALRMATVKFPCLACIIVVIAAAIHSTPVFGASAKWAPFPVYEWNPPFDMASPREERLYTPLESADKDWRLCVSFPHLKDAYWLGVNYGIVDEARRMDVHVSLHEAGGYSHLDNQIRQIEACLENGMDALIVSAIGADGLNDVLGRVHAAGIPIVDLINGVSYPKIDAKSLIDFYDSGFAAGRYIVDRHKGESRPVRVLWFPGPFGASWVSRGNKGFTDALKGSNIRIVEIAYGDTGKLTQEKLISAALDRNADVDYIAGTSVTAEAAIGVVRERRIAETTKIVAYYFGPGIYRGLKRGTILAAASDLQAIQGRIAVDQAVRILQGEPYMKHVGPRIQVIDRDSLPAFDAGNTLAPIGFKATFDVN